MRNRYLLLLDLVLVPLAIYASLALRLDRLDIAPYWGAFALFSTAASAITVAVFAASGVYSRYWRLASADDALRLLASVAAVSVLAGLFAFGVRMFLGGPVSVPRSIPLLFPFLGGALLALPRLMLRFALGHDLRRRIHAFARRTPATRAEPRNVLVIGAGFTGGMLARELRNSPRAGVRVAGFIDDDPAKHGLLIHGAPVLGDRSAIPDAVRRFDVSEIVIAIPSAPGRVIRELLDICEKTGAITRTMPSLHELMDGTVSVTQLRNVQIEDLLRRHPVKIDAEAVAEFVRRKRVLVTGAGGSIGSELCRQIARCHPSELSILGHGENSIFAIENELRRAFPRLPLHVYIADVTRLERLNAVFGRSRPDIVFHAAAHKHVPLMEGNPSEAVITNIIGTRNVLQASLGHGARHFVLISSDKAVNPTSVMGATKRASELLVHQAAVRSGLPYVAVRFGNVLGSRGSVVHTFREQIARGGPVTVTHPDMRRYFMTIPEAVQLVLQSAVLGTGGEVFMLDMGEPVRIVDLAEAMVTLSGLELGRDIDIAFTGLRPGEKLFEEMFAPGERYDRTAHDKIFIAANAGALVPAALNELVAELAQAADRDDGAHIRQLLGRLIPEFNHQPRGETPAPQRGDEAPLAAQGTLAGNQPVSARA